MYSIKHFGILWKPDLLATYNFLEEWKVISNKIKSCPFALTKIKCWVTEREKKESLDKTRTTGHTFSQVWEIFI